MDSGLGALLKPKMVAPLTQIKETAAGLDCGGVGGNVLFCLWKDGVGSTVCSVWFASSALFQSVGIAFLLQKSLLV